jgi:hypothetical protein
MRAQDLTKRTDELFDLFEKAVSLKGGVLFEPSNSRLVRATPDHFPVWHS